MRRLHVELDIIERQIVRHYHYDLVLRLSKSIVFLRHEIITRVELLLSQALCLSFIGLL